jgi:CubicO group peptidase (beta-lactamase class C family)
VLHGSPGGGTYGPIRELGYFYEALQNGGQRGGRILQAETVALMTSRVRVDMVDETFKLPIDWGLGLIIDSKHDGREQVPYGYGRFASPDTFGHSGSQSSVGMCDPVRGLVVALTFNGMCGEARHQRRIRAAIEAIYEDLQLADAN